LLVASAVSFAAGGFALQPAAVKLITVGQTRAEVLAAIGRPAHNVKYRNEPGRTWTYGVLGVTVQDNTVFDVDFGADGKVVSTSECVESVDSAGHIQ